MSRPAQHLPQHRPVAAVLAVLASAWEALAAWLNPADAVENLSDWQYEAMCFVLRLVAFLLIVALVVAFTLLKVKGALA